MYFHHHHHGKYFIIHTWSSFFTMLCANHPLIHTISSMWLALRHCHYLPTPNIELSGSECIYLLEIIFFEHSFCFLHHVLSIKVDHLSYIWTIWSTFITLMQTPLVQSGHISKNSLGHSQCIHHHSFYDHLLPLCLLNFADVALFLLKKRVNLFVG
jgi:hypothetical protein